MLFPKYSRFAFYVLALKLLEKGKMARNLSMSYVALKIVSIMLVALRYISSSDVATSNEKFSFN